MLSQPPMRATVCSLSGYDSPIRIHPQIEPSCSLVGPEFVSMFCRLSSSAIPSSMFSRCLAVPFGGNAWSSRNTSTSSPGLRRGNCLGRGLKSRRVSSGLALERMSQPNGLLTLVGGLFKRWRRALFPLSRALLRLTLTV
eukprot:scaffold65012_cov66-Phaeocystis_antarctica.AAC.1